MSGPVALGFDFGTSNVKAVFYGESVNGDLSVLACGSSSTLEVNTRNDAPGCCEQDPEMWIGAMHESVNAALLGDDGTISNRLASIGVSGQQHGMVAVDSQGSVIRQCMLWCDTQADAEAKKLSEFVGRCIPPGYTAPKIMWLRENERGNYDLTAKFMLPHDYINFVLSGRKVWVMEPSDCSGTGLFDIRRKCFDQSIVDFIDPELAAKLPELHLSAGVPIGHADPGILARLLPVRTSTAPVVLSCGGGDNAMSALGAGASFVDDNASSHVPANTSASHGKVIMSLGTSGTLFGSSPVPVEDVSGVVAPFCDAAGSYLPLLCVQNCASVLEEMRLSVESTDVTDVPSIEEVTALAEGEVPGCEGVTLLPYLSSGGERTPNWPHACGVLYGLRLGHIRRPGLLYRAAAEAVTLSLYRGYTHMRSCGYPAPSYIGLVGGGANNRLWRQIIADVFQVPVSVVYGGVEGGRYCGFIGALGAAFQAMAVCVGEEVAAFANTQCQKLEASSVETGAIHLAHPNVYHMNIYQKLFEKRVALEDVLANTQHWT